MLKDLAVLVPYILYWTLFFIFRKRLIFTTPVHFTLGIAISVTSFIMYKLDYSYEALLLIETVVPFIMLYPYFFYYFKWQGVMLPLMMLCICCWIFQTKGAMAGEWYYDFTGLSGRYLTGFVDGHWDSHGFFTSSLLYLGVKMPVPELIFYPSTMIGLACKFCALSFALKDYIWERPIAWIRRIVIPIHGFCFLTIFAAFLSVVIMQHRFPWLAALSVFAHSIFWAGFFLSPQVRKLIATRMYLVILGYGVIEFVYWEWLHSAVLSHWMYSPERTVAGAWTFLQNIRFPDWSLVCSKPYYYPLEEYISYITTYPSTYILLLLFSRIYGESIIHKDRFSVFLFGKDADNV